MTMQEESGEGAICVSVPLLRSAAAVLLQCLVVTGSNMLVDPAVTVSAGQ